VLAAVTHVASEAALTDFSVESINGEETEEILNHPFELLLRKPNPLDSRYEFIYSTVAMKKLTGNAYWWMSRSNPTAPPDEIWLIPSHMIEPVPDGKMYLKGYLYHPGNGGVIPLEPYEICHFRSFNPFNRFVGLSAVESLVLAATGDIGMQTWNAKFFSQNNARLPGILTFEQYIEDGQWEKIKNDTREASKKRELMMLRGVGQGGVNWMQNAVSQKDMEFLLGRKANRDEMWTVLAPGLASMMDTNATEANAIAGRATFKERAVYPELVTMSEKITTTILPAYGDNLFGKYEDIRYVDRQLELLEQDTYAKSHTVEEIRREYYSDKPIGDERDQLFITQITADTGKAVEEPEIVEVVETTPPVEQDSMTPEEIKALVEIDKWDAKSVKAGKLTVWHNVNIPTMLYNALKSGEITFEQAREQVKGIKEKIEYQDDPVKVLPPVPDFSVLLQAMRLEVEGIKESSRGRDPQPVNVTVHNYPDEPVIVNVDPPIVNVEPAIVNVPEPVVTVTSETKDNAPDESADVVKAIRTLAKGRKKK
jgi:phage portal protein BeeE